MVRRTLPQPDLASADVTWPLLLKRRVGSETFLLIMTRFYTGVPVKDGGEIVQNMVEVVRTWVEYDLILRIDWVTRQHTTASFRCRYR